MAQRWQTTYLGDNPAWAKKKRTCLERALVSLGLRGVVAVHGSNVILRAPDRKHSKQLENAVARLERRCHI